MTTEKITCTCCGKERDSGQFYASISPFHAATKKLHVCKQCLLKIADSDIENQTHIQNLLRMLDKPYLHTTWLSSIEEAANRNRHLFSIYMKNLGLRHNRMKTWQDSEFDHKGRTQTDLNTDEDSMQKEEDRILLDDTNKKDVLRMLGYDPFEGEIETDKRLLYNNLVNFLDEGTLEDNFKLPAVIEIVKGFNQIDKINRAIATITSDVANMSNQAGGIKSLIDSKEKILKSMLALAKDNGISVNHNNNKSKGAGTLSGIIKTLQEKGFEEGEVNQFDIETAKGIRQVADQSNKSIMDQLQFDENDYTSMLMEQREIIQDLDSRAITLEEENRKLKKELFSLRKTEGTQSND
ncbi:hypothetical protein P8907_20100 [Bacillus atrophaeus]|nr:hypothetical protein [Bacillus atrophaeus]MCY8907834.1 hypothetical protein [Bacillus atrophaeus]MEC0837840.1 hypothetical protein [Bacillus atrophaeus]MEC0847741.1 hypothetical protein [Bacillus atrophaeus]MEC0849960.1 hypothetical protein [Bacillus atrophaeus]MEC0866430.1 hypothetical protein [Bacillus atrophaeus]